MLFHQSTSNRLMICLSLALFSLPLYRQTKSNSFDLNKTVSSGGIEEGTGEEVENRFNRASSTEDLTQKHVGKRKNLRQEAGKPKTKKQRAFDGDINTGPARRRGKGDNLSGVLDTGECETHSIDCSHWKHLDAKTRMIHSKRLSRRRRMQNEEIREKSSENRKKWLQQFDQVEKKKLFRYQYARSKVLFNQLPESEQQKKVEKYKEQKRAHKARVKLKVRALSGPYLSVVR